MNGHALLLITALCWVALAFALLGSFVRRFAVMRKIGMLVLWLAFAIYLLGLAGTLALLDSISGKEGALTLLLLVGIPTLLPLTICTALFIRVVRSRRSANESQGKPKP